jgi:type VI secretion system protein ImpM
MPDASVSRRGRPKDSSRSAAREGTATTHAQIIGWFGKIPGLGDFASRRLPDTFVRRWDDWLQRGLLHARSDQGDAWIERYLVAPIWRFWLSPGTLDDSGWAGLLMPSIDRVERHFPLTLAQPQDSLATALAAVDWYRALDAAARQVLDLSFTVDDLEQVLRAIAPPRAVGVDGGPRRLADRLWQRCGQAAPCSVWWCDDAGDDTSFLCLPALPSAQALASMWGTTR